MLTPSIAIVFLFILCIAFHPPIMKIAASSYVSFATNCTIGFASITYLEPCARTIDADLINAPHGSIPLTILLDANVVMDGFHLTDPTSGALYSPDPPFIDTTELASTFRIDWKQTEIGQQDCAALIDPINGDNIQFMLSTYVDDSSILSDLRITTATTPGADGTPLLTPLQFPLAPMGNGPVVFPSNASNEFQLSYECASSGNVAIILQLTILLSNSTTGQLVQTSSYSIKFSKYCSPTSCDGLCLHGTCNPITNRCDCDPGFNLDAFCSYSITANTTSACAMETIKLSYDVTDLRSGDPTAATDWLGIMGPSLSCPGCPWSPSLVAQEYYTGYMPDWFYLSSTSVTWTGFEPRMRNTYEFALMDDLPGDWAMVFFLSDSSTEILAIVVVTQLPREHPRCVALAETRRIEIAQQTVNLQASIQEAVASEQTTPFWAPLPSDHIENDPTTALVLTSSTLTVSDLLGQQSIPCVSGTLSMNNSCICPIGRWGNLCEYGCEKDWIERIEWFGTEFGSTVVGLNPQYRNYASCSWLIVVPSPATGIRISVPLIATESSDYLKVFVGDSNDTTTFTSVASISGVYTHGSADIILNGTYALIKFESDLAHSSEPWSSYLGVGLSYVGIGCPPGHIIQSGMTILNHVPLGLSNVKRCVPCQPGHANPIVDHVGVECEPCRPGTFAPSAGMVECEPVPVGYFQTEYAGISAESCVDAGWPSACGTAPYPVAHTWSSVTIHFFFALILVLLVILFCIIIKYRQQRVLFHASPQFLLSLVVSLIWFVIGLILHVQAQTTQLCNAKLFFLYPAPSILLTTLLVRQWRLFAIFNNAVLKMVKVPLWRLWTTVVVVTMIDIIALIIIVSIHPYRVNSTAFPICEAEGQPPVLPILEALLALKGLLSLILIAMCWSTRSIPDTYNEVKSITLGTLLILFLTTLGIILSYGPLAASLSVGAIVSGQISLGMVGVVSLTCILFGLKLIRLGRSLLTGNNQVLGVETRETLTCVKSSNDTIGEGSSNAGETHKPRSRAPISRRLSGTTPFTVTTLDTSIRSVGIGAAWPPTNPVPQLVVTGKDGTGPGVDGVTVIAAAGDENGASPCNAPVDIGTSVPVPSTLPMTQSGRFLEPTSLPNLPDSHDHRRSLSNKSDNFQIRLTPHQPISSVSNTESSNNILISTTPTASSRVVPSLPSDSDSSSSLRSRWLAARSVVVTLQGEVTRMKLTLATKEQQLSRATNRAMTLAFEMDST